MGWQVGAGVALASAFVSNLGFLWRHRGAVEAPDVDVRRPLQSAIGLFKSKWWTIGYVAAFVSWLLHVGALSLAPLSIVQAALARSPATQPRWWPASSSSATRSAATR